jgi:hypothetical protein
MSRYEVPGSVRTWDLGQLGEVHEVESADGQCQVWLTTKRRCPGHARYVWAQCGRGDVCYCAQHGADTFPEVRNKPDSGRPALALQ